jgi:small-conductance mechanosensitive channel
MIPHTAMRTISAWIAILVLALSVPAGTASAQPPLPPSAPLTAAQARAASDVLRNDAERAKLISVLDAIAKAGPQAAAPPPPAPAPAPAQPPAQAPAPAAPPAAAPAPAAKADEKPAAPVLALAPNSVGAQLLYGVSEQISDLSNQVVNIANTATDFPLLWQWVRRVATDRQSQLAIFDALWRMLLVLGAGIATEWVARRALRRPINALRDRAPSHANHVQSEVQGIADAEAGQTEWTRRKASAVGLVRRLPYIAGGFVLDLLPVVCVIAAGYVLLAAGVAGGLTSRLVVLAMLNAYVFWRFVVSVARAIASPKSAKLRVIPISDSSARVFVREVSALTAVAVAGYAVAEAGLLFGLYQLAHDALLKLNALIVYAMVVRIVMRNRRGMKNALRAPDGSKGVLAAVRNALASSWHRIVVVYLLALWLVWALDIENGFSRLLRLMMSAVVVAVAARLVSLAVHALMERLLRSLEGLDDRYPGMEQRIAGYHPVVNAGTNAVIALVAIVALFQAWGFDALAWFAPNALGARVTLAGATIAATVVGSLAVWELVNAAIARHLAQLARNAQLARSARLRTLLPMFRTALLVTVSLIAGLVILSEIGVNIAPLLAGAGVIGLAIGFGSQKLVQDIITGLFLLLENAMQVGDVVTLGGLSGTVENLSIRTIRLRALDGAVHIVPFSAVTTVTNSTRDYGFAVVDVSIGLNEEPDRISDLLRDLAAQMRTEQPWRGLILADLEVMGLEKFIDTAWVLRIRIKTLPASRWSVSRELNRRIKYRFDELAIESPMTSYRVLSMVPAPAEANSDAPETATVQATANAVAAQAVTGAPAGAAIGAAAGAASTPKEPR